MRHGQKTKELGLKRNQRKALVATLAVSLIRDGKIKTTLTKAKVLRPMVERLITQAKGADVGDRRILISKVGVATSKKLIETLAPKYQDRRGGYLRIIRLNDRKSDGSKMAVVEFV